MTTSKERPREAQPTDLELMLYFDGELEEPRKSAVAAFLAADLGARNKLRGLQVTSGFMQTRAHDLDAAPGAHAADDIADLVLAKIEAEASTKQAPVVAEPGAKILPFPGSRAPTTSPHRSGTPARRPANDNVRRIIGVATLAVAAAAALAIWGKQTTGSGLQSGPVAVTTPASVPAPQASPGLPSSAGPQVDVASVTPEGDVEEHGVEVATVNFGAHMGSIFYVPSGSIEANRTTTVVWLADDAGE